MTKKLISKIVSAILVMAICLTTVFGCLITVNAADTTGTYTITSDEVPSGARTATTYVTFTSGSDAGFSSGKFDLMFHNDLLDKDENGNVYEDGTTVLPTDTDENGMISAYNVYKLDADGNIMLDEKGNKIVEKTIKENATNSGTRLPNAYGEKYVDTNDDGVNDSIVSNLYDTKIEIYSATATDGTALDVATAFTAPTDDTTGFSTAGDRSYKYVLLDEYKNYEASETQLNKYSRSYSHIDVVTSNLSYDISTVSEDSTGLVGRYAQYAQGFKNVSFDAGDNTCKSITFKVTFDFLGRTDRMSANSVAPTQEELENSTDKRADGRYCGDNQVQLGLNYILTLTPDSESDIAEFEDTNTDYRKSNFHIHFYYTTSKETDIISSGKDYTVYQGYCDNCLSTASTYKAPMIADKFVAERLEESAAVEENKGIGRYYFHNYKNIYGFNVVYEKDGTLSVNIHFDQYTSGDTFIIGLFDGTKIAKYEDTLNATTPATSFFATVEHWVTDDPSDIIRDVRPLKTSGKMVTIKGLSAKDIDTKFYIARMGNDGTGVDQIGRTHVFSLADYCMKVINEEDVYYVEDIIESNDTVDGIVNNTAASKEEMKAKDKNIAAALINYGEAAKKALAQGYDGNATGRTIYWDGKTSAPVDSDNDGVYEITKASELAYIAKNANSDTAGKTYKVADGISTIVLQSKTTIDNLGGLSKLTALSDADAVKEYFESNYSSLTNWVKASSTTAGFAGTFDGNGTTICGMYCSSNGAYGGLFSGAGALTVKNVEIKNNYVYGDAAAIICAQSSTNDRLTVSNTVIANNVAIASRKDDAYTYGGVMFGMCGSSRITVENCLVYGNIAVHSQYSTQGQTNGTGTKHHEQEYDITYGLFGAMNGSTDTEKNIISNSIILDTTPYSFQLGWNVQYKVIYTNVYTNMTGITITNTDWSSTGKTKKIYNTVATLNDNGTTSIYLYAANADIETAQATYSVTDKAIYKSDHSDVLGNAAGTNMPNLDWSKWSYGPIGEYPTPADENAVVEPESKISYYSGTPATSFSNPIGTGETADSPIIINSADELAYLVGKVNLSGKYYKIADDIDIMVLQPSTTTNVNSLLKFSTAKQVSDYFENEAITPTSWVTPSTVFTGNFDGNGVMIYGLYYDQTTTADGMGLFPRVDGGSVIKNVTVRNSYISSAKKQGAIAGMTYATSAGAKVAGLVTIEKCAVINCYMRAAVTNKQDAGVVIGNTNGDYLTINNCLVYGNDAYSDYFKNNLGLFANLANPSEENVNSVTNSLAIGTAPYPTLNYSYNALDPTRTTVFGNVYTDQPGGKVTLYNYSGADTISDKATFDYGTSITNVDAEAIKGENGAELVEKLNTTDTPVWYVGAIDGYPSFNEVPTVTTDLLDDYAIMQFAYDKYGESTTKFGMYATSLNLKVNPYMAFTFAFAQGTPDYKANRDNITVTFKTASNTITTTVGNGKGGVSDGWSNNADAGRYHLYRLKDITVEDMYKGIEVTVNYDGTNYDFGTFSVGGFVLDLENAYKADPCKYYATRVEAAKALLFYTQMISVRYA